MTLDEANIIRNMKRLCTYRRLAEQWYPERHTLHGNQLAGQDLCREACKVLGIDWMRSYEFGQDKDFDHLNKSAFGDFYWWE